MTRRHLTICRATNWAWTYWDVVSLPASVYRALVELLTEGCE